MHNRSWLIVPGDGETKLLTAASAGADAVIVDLADTVRTDRKAMARTQAAEWLSVHRQHITGGRRVERWVRINPFDSHHWREDLAAVMPGAPDGIVLPHCAGPASVQQLSAELYGREQALHLVHGSVRILPLAGESPAAVLGLRSYLETAMPRLAGLGWRPQHLAAALGGAAPRADGTAWRGAFEQVRTEVLLVAHAAGLQAVETCHPVADDPEGLRAAAQAARADGFTGMMAVHPAQLAEINAAFGPAGAGEAAAGSRGWRGAAAASPPHGSILRLA